MNELTAIDQKITPIKEQAHALDIRSDEDLEAARDRVREVKALLKEIDDTMNPIIAKANAVRNEAMAQKKRHAEPLKEAKGIYEGKMGGYLTQKEAEAHRQAQAEAERYRREQEAMLARLQKRMDKLTEQCGSLHEEIKVLEERLEAPDVEEEEAHAVRIKLSVLYSRRDNKLEAMEDKAQKAESAAVPLAMAVPPPVTKPEGLIPRTDYSVRVVNPLALVKAIANGSVPPAAIRTWNETLLKALAKAGVSLPGVAVDVKKKVSVMKER